MSKSGEKRLLPRAAMECVAPGKRAMVSMVQETGWVLGMMLLPAVAYLVTNWIHLQLLISVPVVLMLVTAL